MSSFITLVQATKMTSDFRNERRSIVDSSIDEGVLPICETFDRAQIDAILSKDGCTGIRIYLGLDAESNVKLVLVGVNETDHDMYLEVDSIADRAVRCPTNCPPSSPLNAGTL